MEELKPNILDELVKQKLEDFEIPTDAADWQLINSALEQQSFWQFSWKSFNAYYAITIVLSLLVSIASFFYYDNQLNAHLEESHTITDTGSSANKQQVSLVDTLANQQEEVEVGNSKQMQEDEILENKESNKKEKENRATLPLPKENTTTSKEIADSLPKTEPVKEMALPSSAKDTIAPNIPSATRTKPKKIIYLTKRDTIFKADTIRRVRRK